MRLPFQLPSGCPPITVNISFVPIGFPLCTIPGITRPTGVMDALPEIPVPHFYGNPCPCIPTYQASHRVSPSLFNKSGNRLRTMRVTYALKQQTVNCCSGVPKISFNLSVPCLPLSLVMTVKRSRPYSVAAPVPRVNQATAPQTPIVRLKPRMASGCRLSVRLDAVVPCLPFNVVPKITAREYPTRRIKTTAHANQNPGACIVTVRVDMNVPAVECPDIRFCQKLVVYESGNMARYVVGGTRMAAAVKITQVVTQRVRCYTVPATGVPAAYTHTPGFGPDAGGGYVVSSAVGNRVTCVMEAVAVPRTYLSCYSIAVKNAPLYGKLTIYKNDLAGLHGTCHNRFQISMALPLIPCAKPTWAHERNVTVVTAREWPTMRNRIERTRRGAHATCLHTHHPTLILPHLTLPVTVRRAGWNDAPGDIPSYYGTFIQETEWRRKLQVDIKPKGGLGSESSPYYRQVVTDVLVVPGVGLVIKRNNQRFEHGLLVEDIELADQTVIGITEC